MVIGPYIYSYMLALARTHDDLNLDTRVVPTFEYTAPKSIKIIDHV